MRWLLGFNSAQFRGLKIVKNKAKMVVIPAEAGIQVSFFNSGFPFSPAYRRQALPKGGENISPF
jgi:hypothetical protein